MDPMKVLEVGWVWSEEGGQVFWGWAVDAEGGSADFALFGPQMLELAKSVGQDRKPPRVNITWPTEVELEAGACR